MNHATPRIEVKCPWCGRKDRVNLDPAVRTYECEWNINIPLVPTARIADELSL